MRDWLSAVTNDRLPEIAISLSLGYALVTLADRIVGVPLAILAQHVGRGIEGEDPEDVVSLIDLFYSPYYLNFSIGETYVAYGPVLSAAIVLGGVGLVAWVVVRRRDRALAECPFCASRIPHESTHCAYCGSGLDPAPL